MLKLEGKLRRPGEGKDLRSEAMISMEERAVREFKDYVSERAIRSTFRVHGYSNNNCLYSIREVLIRNGVEGIPFKSYRSDNDPGELEI